MKVFLIQKRVLRQRGTTLIEILLTVGILMMVGTAVWAFQRNIFSLSRLFNGNLASQQQVQKTFRDFEKEVRTMSQSAGGAYAIEEASSTEFIFFSDVNKDGVMDRVRYFYSTSTKSIRKGIVYPVGTTYTTSTEKVIDRVTNILISATTTPLFTYYDSNYDGVGTTTALTNPVNIPAVRLVKFQIAISPRGQSPLASSTLWFTTQISIRNLKDNL